MPNLRHLSTTRASMLRRVIRHHLLPAASTMLWSSSFAALVWSTITDDANLGRWAILVGLVALLVSTAWLARMVVRRLTQIVALWEEDVPMGSEKVKRLHGTDHRGPRTGGQHPRGRARSV